MDAMSRFKRTEDGKIFVPTHIGHWCDIVALDKSEGDCVKWFGVEHGESLYVSRDKGFTYTLLTGREEEDMLDLERRWLV